MKSCNNSSKLDRRITEKKRRTHMKSLFFRLSSLTPSNHGPQDSITQLDQVDVALDYIKKLQAKIEELKHKRDLAKHMNGISEDKTGVMAVGLRVPLVEVRDLGSCLEVVLISGLRRNFMICDVISIVEQGGADVVSANISFMADKVIHIIHSQVTSCRVGFETERVYERLKELVH